MHFSRIFVEEYHQVVMEVNKFQKLLNFQVRAERFYCWGHQDYVVVEVLIELLNADWITGVATNQFEFQSVIATSHSFDVLKEDRVCFQGCPGVHKNQCFVLALLLHKGASLNSLLIEANDCKYK